MYSSGRRNGGRASRAGRGRAVRRPGLTWRPRSAHSGSSRAHAASRFTGLALEPVAARGPEPRPRPAEQGVPVRAEADCALSWSWTYWKPWANGLVAARAVVLHRSQSRGVGAAVPCPNIRLRRLDVLQLGCRTSCSRWARRLASPELAGRGVSWDRRAAASPAGAAPWGGRRCGRRTAGTGRRGRLHRDLVRLSTPARTCGPGPPPSRAHRLEGDVPRRRVSPWWFRSPWPHGPDGRSSAT